MPHPVERSYYLTDFLDEIMPVAEQTLPAWADWLSKPDADFDRTASAVDGATFAASVVRWDDDIIATRNAQGWAFSRDPSGEDFMAVRFGPGLGWDAGMIVYGDDMAQALRDWLKENDALCEDEEYVAIGMNEPDVVLTFRAGPPPALVVETVQ